MVNPEKSIDEILQEGPALVRSVIIDDDTMVMKPEENVRRMIAPSAANESPTDAVVRIVTPNVTYAQEIGKDDALVCMLNGIGDYAKGGEVNAIAQFYKGNSGMIKNNKILSSVFAEALKGALKVCAKEGRLGSISGVIGAGVPSPIARMIVPAALKAMRVCMLRLEYESIAGFLKTPNLGEQVCSKGISCLVAGRRFDQLRQLLEGGSLPEGAKYKAQRACLKYERDIRGDGVFSRLFKRDSRPKTARPATPARVIRVDKKG
ncbi:hypothetical protein JW721_04145 [Candidatus Micrarchaeota archaeon]|nr:hypothetical protein [Candidatus Micrarchaeota archaeon]